MEKINDFDIQIQSDEIASIKSDECVNDWEFDDDIDNDDDADCKFD